MPTRLRLSCRALLIIVLVRFNLSCWAPAKSSPCLQSSGHVSIEHGVCVTNEALSHSWFSYSFVTNEPLNHLWFNASFVTAIACDSFTLCSQQLVMSVPKHGTLPGLHYSVITHFWLYSMCRKVGYRILTINFIFLIVLSVLELSDDAVSVPSVTAFKNRLLQFTVTMWFGLFLCCLLYTSPSPRD